MLSPVAEARPPAAFADRPADLRPGLSARYWVWTDAAGLHLRWTTSGERRRFAGSLTWEGLSSPPTPFVAVSDSGQSGAPTLARAVDEDGNATLTFEAWSAGGVSGLDLPASSARLTLALGLDALPAPVHALHLGVHGIHPRRNPFRLRPPDPAQAGLDHHAHPHDTPHPPVDPATHHHEHPHPHPHPPGLGHHHPL